MKKFTALLLGFMFAISSAFLFAKGKKDGDFDIEIIHIPPSKHQQSDSDPSEDEEQEPPFFLFVTANALKGHLMHGDCIVPPTDETQGSFVQDAIDNIPQNIMSRIEIQNAIADAEMFEYEAYCGGDGGGGNPPPD